MLEIMSMTMGKTFSANRASFVSWGMSSPLTRVERIALLGLVCVGVAISIGFAVTYGAAGLLASMFQSALIAVFALFAWSAWPAVILFMAAVAVSPGFSNSGTFALVAMAVAVAFVVRVGTVALAAIYAGVFLLATAYLAMGAGLTLPEVTSALLVATGSGAAGVLLRLANERESRLRERLDAQVRSEQEAVRAERLRIADELHDVIAHDLTVIAMHARVLEQEISDDARHESQQTIHEAARKALNDLRRVVEQADEAPTLAEAPLAGLAQTLEASRKELQAARFTLQVDEYPSAVRMPRMVDVALARILRESTTNILKHGEPGPVHMIIRVAQSSAMMTIRNQYHPTKRISDLPSGGHGITRMAARANQLGGDFHTNDNGTEWAVFVQLPLD
jgi:signal transduction histidine kinase